MRVRRRLHVERLAHGIDPLAGVTELVAWITCEVLFRGLDDDVAIDLEVGGGRPIEVTPRGFDGLRFPRCEGGCGWLKRQVETLRNEIFDQERYLDDRIALGIGMQLGAPGSCHGTAAERHSDVAAAQAFIGQRVAAVLDTVGA